MIIRKPYAFLIKNFKRIHILMLILSLFVAYKIFDVSSFVQEFMRLGTYDLYADPIGSHITFFLQLAIVLLVVGSGSLILLLRHKEKPWKAYLIPFIEYILLFFVLGMIKSFFSSYSDDVATTDLRMSRDLLMLFLFGQLPAIGIFVMRTFGLDIKKFNFNMDEEFLELSEADREEFEIRLDVDKNTFKRGFRRLLRNLGYIYKEHKTICNICFGIVGVLVLYNSYKFIFITNRSYKQGDTYSANEYTIKINNSYYTDKDASGKVISKDSDFVVVDVTITNNISRRKLDMDNFHLKNGVSDYTTTSKTYEEEFSDLGSCVDSSKELKRDESINTIIIYKVEKRKWNSNFVLYYQEKYGSDKLRKIKLNIKDISKLEKVEKLKYGDTLKLKVNGKVENISIDDYDIVQTAEYIKRSCTLYDCVNNTYDFTAKDGYNILKLSFGSDNFESKNLIDFLNKYGKISYKDSDGNDEEYGIVNAADRTYSGKFIYLQIPNEINNSSSLSIDIVYRDKRYSYSIN